MTEIAKLLQGLPIGSCLAAALIAAAVLLAGTWPWRQPHPRRSAAFAVLATWAGFAAACLVPLPLPASVNKDCLLFQERIHWLPKEALDRIFYIILPIAFAVELAASFAGRLAWLVWIPRLIIAAGVARVVLHGTVFITDMQTPGTPAWSPEQMWQIFAALAAALLAVWVFTWLLGIRTPGRSAPLAVAFVCGAAAVTVMLSGIAVDPQILLILSAAMIGTVAASCALNLLPDLNGVAGVGLVATFAILVDGRYFGTLSTPLAAVLLFAPLVSWLPEMPPRLQGLSRVLTVCVPITVAVLLAKQKFDDESARTAPPTKGASSSDVWEPSPDDYGNFGK